MALNSHEVRETLVNNVREREREREEWQLIYLITFPQCPYAPGANIAPSPTHTAGTRGLGDEGAGGRGGGATTLTPAEI